MSDTIEAGDALSRLLEGNARYKADRAVHPHGDSIRRQALTAGQAPFAVVLTCADSRVVPELIFDQGLGDLFVIRLAGNIVDRAVRGSIEYAVTHLDTKLVLVLGHQSCGAVTAAVGGQPADCSIDELIEALAPAVREAKGLPGDVVDNAIRVNARQVADGLRTHPDVLGPATKAGLRVLPAYYRLSDGGVELLS
jgi:carbonic anhydrase